METIIVILKHEKAKNLLQTLKEIGIIEIRESASVQNGEAPVNIPNPEIKNFDKDNKKQSDK